MGCDSLQCLVRGYFISMVCQLLFMNSFDTGDPTVEHICKSRFSDVYLSLIIVLVLHFRISLINNITLHFIN